MSEALSETVEVHVPRTRNGGTFSNSKDVKLHANDFDWEAKMAELGDSELELVQEYLQTCLSDLAHAGTSSAEVDVPPKPWESHFSSSKHHFPLKNYIVHAFPLLRGIVDREEPPAWILECGCGTGSTLLPIMRECKSTATRFVGFDISASALSHFSSHEVAVEYAKRGALTLFPLAIGSHDDRPCESSEDSVQKRQRLDDRAGLLHRALASFDTSLSAQKFDAVFLIFVLSALPSVDKMLLALQQLKRVMKADGILMFRDYALPDHNFFRFLSKTENKVGGVAFAKGDSTTQAFFHKEFAQKLFAMAGFEEVEDEKSKLTYHCNRIENRKNGKRMDKIFINGTFRLKLSKLTSEE